MIQEKGQFSTPAKILAVIMLLGIVVFILLFITRGPSFDAADAIKNMVGKAGEKVAGLIGDVSISSGGGDGPFNDGQQDSSSGDGGDGTGDGSDIPVPDTISAGEIGGGQGFVEKYPDQAFCEPPGNAILVRSKTELLQAFQQAGEGEVIYVEPDARIDMSGELNVNIPGGVTLASNRGCDGAEGGVIYKESGAKQSTPMLSVAQPGVTITGLKFEGPGSHKEPHARNDHGLAISAEADDFELYNNHIDNFPQMCSTVRSGKNSHFHHNTFTYCNRLGYGYGVSAVSSDPAVIEFNYFDHTRHSIAANSNSYIARYNIFGPHRQNHQADMHNQGEEIIVHHNTFRHWEGKGTYSDVKLKVHLAWGAATSGESAIYNNWFENSQNPIRIGDQNPSADSADVPNLRLENNHYGYSEPPSCDIGAPREGCPAVSTR